MAAKITGYRSFWTAWLGCAGATEGTTLFNIQKFWGITTNYLYHREPGLNKPIYKAMKEEGFIEKERRKIKARFDWIPEYVISMHKPAKPDEWSINVLLLENWSIVQEFIEKNRDILFNPENLKVLYGNLGAMNRIGPYIFDDIFMLIIISNILPFCTKYGANIVARIMFTLLSMSPGRNLLGYFKAVKKGLGLNREFPKIITNESMLMDVLYPME